MLHLKIIQASIALQLLGFLTISIAAPDSKKESSTTETCEVFAESDFGDPILILKNVDTVYDINLISDRNTSIANSIRLHSNCALFTCSLPKFNGDCEEHFISNKLFISKPLQFQSAICQCSLKRKPDSLENVDKKQSNVCAILFEEWNFSGSSQSILFSGSAGGINLQPDLKSVRIRPNCSVTLWKQLSKENTQVSLSLENTTTYLKPAPNGPYEWYCCHCDTNSEDVCNQAKDSGITSSTLGQPEEDDGNQQNFSQFVKYGKKIIGIGRNYRWKKSELAKVLKEPLEPIVFMKPSTSYIIEGQQIELLESLGTIFYEIELGVVIGKKGRSISNSEALDYVAGYFLALDMTAKGFLKKSINQSLPWEIGKGFDTACPVGHFIPKHLIPNPNDIHLLCKVNGNVTQSDNTSGMIFDVPHLISYISKYMTLEPYDVILTGTPDGLGPLSPGDVIEGQLGNLTTIRFEAVAVNDKI